MTTAPPLLPSPRDVSLLTNIRPLPAAVASQERWRNGLQFAGDWEGLDSVRPEPALCEDPQTFSLPTIPTHPQIDFRPFLVNIAQGCAAFTPETDDEVEAYANAALEANGPWAVERQFWLGAADQTIPHLQSVASVISGGPYSLQTAVARLLDERAQEAPSSPVLVHGPAGIAALLEQYGMIQRRNATLVGADGWRYVPGAGYPKISDTNNGPWATKLAFPTSFSDANLGKGAGTKGTVGADTNAQCWLYVTGAVEYAQGPIFGNIGGRHVPFGEDTFWSFRTNEWVVFPQREVIYRFDPFHVFAILATVPA